MNQLLLITTIVFNLIFRTNAFSYKDPENWGKHYPECKGKHQSPIIYKPTSVSEFTSIKQKLRLIDFDKLPTKLTLNNTGHTVEIRAKWSGEPPKITAGPLDGYYVLEKTTFLWDQKKWPEELVPEANVTDYYMIDMEMHVFFYKTDLKSFDIAQKQKGGLAVLKMGLLSGIPNPGHFFDNVEKNLNKVQSQNSAVEIPPFRFLSTFEKRVPPFLYYEGSLDHPPCWESVTWFITDGSLITTNMLNEFRKIKLAEGDVSNVRPRQALNDRKIKSAYVCKKHNV